MITATTIYEELLNHVRNCGGSYSSWYAGIATNAEDRLFVEHNVSKYSGQWAYRDAGSEIHARQIEKQLLNLGFSGGPGGGLSPRMVYVYRKTTSTRP